MFDWLRWFTQMENTKPFALVMFFVTFVGIIWYVYSNKKRSERFESYKNIPLNDDEDEQATHPEEK
ncbi:MAG: cbb3-type cytochrome c oxidase subunit 3 [Gammaproteobacteria bacterium]|nr:cbb3-type cytochrome c oxidase subunit 3 [Gammaproteobacteria bacterium]MDH5777873.1 cbb3-type cytochrome c oxidase subunit 3 [Gammaproteobacteria bacterium]